MLHGIWWDIPNSEYAISYTALSEDDHGSEQLEDFINGIAAILQTSKGLDEYQKGVFKDRFVAFDFRSHLYAPLICFNANGLKIQVSPVSLNEDEKTFIDLLKDYTEKNRKFLQIRAYISCVIKVKWVWASSKRVTSIRTTFCG